MKTQMDLIYRGINSSGPERRLFPESRETSCRPSSLQETRRAGPVAEHPGWSCPTLFPLKAFSPAQRLRAPSGPYVAVWGALVWPTATLQAGHLDLGATFNLDFPHAPGHLHPHPLPPAVPTGCRASTHSSYCGFGSVELG